MPDHRFTQILLSLFTLFLVSVATADDYDDERLQMILEIEQDVVSTASRIGRESFDKRVMAAMQTVPRHKFVPEHLQNDAYDNRPLPVGFGQTISQPYIVALMTDLLQPASTDRVLEIGTGSGYQAAVLAELVDEVYSIEIVEPLAQRTQKLLGEIGYESINTRIADGYDGWPEHAPFDSIIVTAAISHIPPPLVKQLKNGGRMVIPVGTRFQTQYLTLVEKDANGSITTRQLLPVIFVPFTGGH